MKENRGSLLRLWRVFIAIVLVSAVDPFLASSAKASDIVVEQCDEAGLTGALTTVQGSGGGTITFSCGPDPVTITITVMKNIITDVAINGGGLISLSGGNSTRLFKVNSGASLALQNITLRDGFSSGADGGAIWNEGILTVENSKFLENSSDLAKSGGAIVSYGPLTIIDSEFSDNQAYNGGAVYPRCERRGHKHLRQHLSAQPGARRRGERRGADGLGRPAGDRQRQRLRRELCRSRRWWDLYYGELQPGSGKFQPGCITPP